MKTDDLIEMLARNAGPAPRVPIAWRLMPVMVLGFMTSSLLALLVIGPLPLAVFQTSAPWIKLFYALLLTSAAYVLTARLARPIARLQAAHAAVLSVIAAMVLFGAVALGLTPRGERWETVLGETWLMCPFLLMGFSLPSLAGILWAVKGLAPTQPKRAGGACGLLAGAIGAAGYSLACPESSVTFVAIWYTIGIGFTALLGRALGHQWLRW
jgi:hypothetical protein